jgi:hypothetical protein
MGFGDQQPHQSFGAGRRNTGAACEPARAFPDPVFAPRVDLRETRVALDPAGQSGQSLASAQQDHHRVVDPVDRHTGATQGQAAQHGPASTMDTGAETTTGRWPEGAGAVCDSNGMAITGTVGTS